MNDPYAMGDRPKAEPPAAAEWTPALRRAADRAPRAEGAEPPALVCRYAEEIGLPPHACTDCSYDPDEIKARRAEPPVPVVPARTLMRLKRFYDGNNDAGNRTWNAAIQACVDALARPAEPAVVPAPDEAMRLRERIRAALPFAETLGDVRGIMALVDELVSLARPAEQAPEPAVVPGLTESKVIKALKAGGFIYLDGSGKFYRAGLIGDSICDQWVRQVFKSLAARPAEQDTARDAARYQFIRDADRSDDALAFDTIMALSMESLDAAVDAAIAEGSAR